MKQRSLSNMLLSQRLLLFIVALYLSSCGSGSGGFVPHDEHDIVKFEKCNDSTCLQEIFDAHSISSDDYELLLNSASEKTPLNNDARSITALINSLPGNYGAAINLGKSAGNNLAICIPGSCGADVTLIASYELGLLKAIAGLAPDRYNFTQIKSSAPGEPANGSLLISIEKGGIMTNYFDLSHPPK